MAKDHATVWDNCLQTIRRMVPDQSFKTWFEPIRPVSLRDNSLVIQVPNRFFYEWLEEHYVGILKHTIREELGDRGQLLYQIITTQEPASTASARRSAPPSVHGGGTHSHTATATATSSRSAYSSDTYLPPGSIDSVQIKNPFIIPGIKKPRIDSQLSNQYTFDTFLEADCNQLARSAGLAIADRPGNSSFNPLIIYGDVGLGKTHLAQAIGNRITEQHPAKTVLYVPVDKFTNQIIQSIKNNAVNDLTNFYQLVDVLIMDDIQFLAEKQKTQEIFFNIFNQLHQTRKQIILTSDRPPRDMQGISERLISRFKWGLTADLQVPDIETRMAILEAKAKREGVSIPAAVLEFISYHVRDNIRELEGALTSLIYRATIQQKEYSIAMARELINNLVKAPGTELTVGYIQQLVAEHYNLSVETLMGKSRKREVVMARQMAMHLSKKMTDKPLKVIGEAFGGRDHSTVIYSCNTALTLLESDTNYRRVAEEVEQKLRMSMLELC